MAVSADGRGAPRFNDMDRVSRSFAWQIVTPHLELNSTFGFILRRTQAGNTDRGIEEVTLSVICSTGLKPSKQIERQDEIWIIYDLWFTLFHCPPSIRLSIIPPLDYLHNVSLYTKYHMSRTIRISFVPRSLSHSHLFLIPYPSDWFPVLPGRTW